MPLPTDTPAAPKEDDVLDALIATMSDDPGAPPVITPAAELPAPTAPVIPDPAAPQDPPTPATPAAPAPSPAAPAPPPVKVVRRSTVTREDLEAVVAKITAKPPLPDPTPVATPVAADTSGLTDDQRYEYETALWAETKDPKYKGKAAALLAGWKDVAAYVSQRAADGDPVDPDKDDEFRKVVAAKVPKIPAAELRRLEHQRIAEEAAAKVRGEVDAELNAARQEARVARVEPVIMRDVDALESDLKKELASDDPLEVDVFTGAREAAIGYADEYLRIAAGVLPVNQAPNYPAIFAFVQGKAADFAAAGKDLVRAGKTFATPEELAKLPSDERANRWTFGKADVLRLIKEEAVSQAKEKVKKEIEIAEKRGFVRKSPASQPSTTPSPAATPATTPATPAAPTPITPPRATGSIPPGAGLPRQPSKEADDFDITSTLKMD